MLIVATVLTATATTPLTLATPGDLFRARKASR